MSEIAPDSADVAAPTVEKKSHRVQVRVPPPEFSSQTELHPGKSPGVRESLQPNVCEPQQVGILRGAAAYTKSYRNSDDILKHLAVAYLFTILKSPPKWSPETFSEIVAQESSIAKAPLETKLPIYRNDKTYNIHLSSTLVKGRFVTPQDRSDHVHLSIHQALSRIKRGKAAVWKCDGHFFLIRRLLTGWYFYTPSLQDKPALMFFSCPQLMVNLVQDTYGCTERSKYFLSNVVLHSVEEGDVVRIVWKMKRSIGMKLLSPLEAILHGNIYLVRPSLERSLEIGLNVLDRAQQDRTKPRSWDNKLLNGCFKRVETHWKAAERMACFVRDKSEPNYTIGGYTVTCRTSPIGHRQRKHFEEMVNYFLASCTALLIVGRDCCFVFWARDSFMYWFSPYRYSALQERPEIVQSRACFLHMTNALAKASQSLYEYLYELGVFPDSTIELLPVRIEDGSAHAPILDDGDEDSLDQEGLTIPPASEQGWTNFYSPTLHSPSELRLARQMLDMVYQTAEDRCG
uniref:Fungal-type protein kinase domain-containing protein n=1 Tax=Anopheles coluzzii TaxID=1518534 RepID=A0A6E8VMG7_ANOCL